MSDEPSDYEVRSIALHMRANHIETGNVAMSAADVQQQLTRVRSTLAECRARGFEIKPLLPEQVELVARLRAMAAAELQAEIDFNRTHPRQSPRG